MNNIVKVAVCAIILSARQVGVLNAVTIDIAIDSSWSMLQDD